MAYRALCWRHGGDAVPVCCVIFCRLQMNSCQVLCASSRLTESHLHRHASCLVGLLNDAGVQVSFRCRGLIPDHLVRLNHQGRRVAFPRSLWTVREPCSDPYPNRFGFPREVTSFPRSSLQSSEVEVVGSVVASVATSLFSVSQRVRGAVARRRPTRYSSVGHQGSKWPSHSCWPAANRLRMMVSPNRN